MGDGEKGGVVVALLVQGRTAQPDSAARIRRTKKKRKRKKKTFHRQV
jgi:hypothetical protein